MKHPEQERLKHARAYFEDGCLCINVKKTLNKLPDDVPDGWAANYYHEFCTCSRNYKDE